MQSIFKTNKTALVTGASPGIGLELARALAPKLNTLIVVARRVERLEHLAKELRSRFPGISIAIEASDLSIPEDVQKLLHKLEASELRVDVLVNNGGWGNPSCSTDLLGAEFVRSSRSTLLRCSASRTTSCR